ncbi:hypothetical protein WALSEDRAFT_59880 [Wallemia mellicola CBS 633.66]|uniref:Structural maintenance of chromosomes protein n=2 Tax=Wallemia mellicola TaxID=1708541 RepID=A0A4T0SC05_9BASI|nr:hypothetical protein WALSEDRAFT_59880 [Wallemia mellicola CBS 633.66]TIB83795.1 hypothetical protein E3Q21_02693 [Wallemia mellicola]EIM22666.1 hypothetical protein WALSEDRAFT_59880 [Wallemia mellicola CBS 633.66]TIB86824.1 hypothetical protein E3Q20_02685 [Wallemia mellicola]TIC35251.1 hypothetical protein E3Q09_02422 [Wallemia mellicola]TIC39755.1 hypothetical protein E3Q07_02702 [Wallemia mellicola]|eukprot:XP_006957331.1 hypothetical protein WALSEDRAFT_59880 [Wallemia mellicola CBS 633.66]
MDAISFVLGVKSAHLRGSNIRDLIYRGRRVGLENDAPIEQTQEGDHDYYSAQKASVLALYKNASGRQFRFERTITLSGSSEYRLDGKAITFADYNKALANENILVKTKNFLVFQGDVEAVATQSPSQLSKLIDQISGSIEHKERYDETKNAQERANDTSVGQGLKRRVLNGEIKQFKEQTSELKRFEDMKDRKENMIMRLLLMKLYHIETQIQSNTEAISSKREFLQQLSEDQDNAKRELKKATKAKAESHNNTIKTENAIKSSQREIDEKAPAIVTLDARINHAQIKLKTSEGNAVRLQAEVSELEERVDRYKKDVEKIEKAAERAQSEARKLTESRGVKLSDEDLDEYRQLKTVAISLVPDARKELEKLKREEKTSKSTLNASRSRLTEAEAKHEKLQLDERRAIANVEDTKDAFQAAERGLQDSRQKHDNMLTTRNKINQLEAEKNEKLQALLGQLSSASHDIRQTERDNKFKDVLMTLKRMFPGVRGKLVDLCQPTQSKYSTAVVTALGRNVESIVVDDEATAIQCIDYMKAQRVGSATYLPLDSLQVKPIQERLRTISSGARLTVDVLKYDSIYEKAIQFAAGNSLVCDNMNIARDVVYDKQQDVKAVTLDGTIIHRSGLITGGQGARDTGRRFDQAQYDQMMRRRDELVIQLKALRARRPQAKQDEELVEKVKKCENEQNIAKDSYDGAVSRLQGISKELAATESDHGAKSREFEEVMASYDKLKHQLDNVIDTINEAEDGVFASFCDKLDIENIREYEDREGRVAAAESEARVKFETQIAKLNNLLRFEQEQLRTSGLRLERLQNRLETDRQNLDLLESERGELHQSIDVIKAKIDEYDSLLKDLRETEQNSAENVDQVRRVSQKAEREYDGALKDIANDNDNIRMFASERFSIYRKCKVDELPLALVAGSLEDVPIDADLREIEPMDVDNEEDSTQRAVQIDDYGIEVNFDEVEDEDELTEEAELRYQQEIETIGLEIERMAPNLKASDRLNDMKNKLNDTEKEFERARKETKQARDTFQDTKALRQELFMNAFNHISNSIDSVYKELTTSRANPTGGTAYLSLEDEDEPYNAGIKYHAMPPGKPFRDMFQLSGGEKTMAAMALLFAIQTYKPSPFFVLDEVDSALDNQNAAQIAKYLRNHLNDSQYLFITHSSRVFERADALVGVFRNGDINSSQVLTLDLTQYDE